MPNIVLPVRCVILSQWTWKRFWSSGSRKPVPLTSYRYAYPFSDYQYFLLEHTNTHVFIFTIQNGEFFMLTTLVFVISCFLQDMVEVVVMLRAAIQAQGLNANLGADSKLASR